MFSAGDNAEAERRRRTVKAVSKALFLPFSVLGGLLAGLFGKKAFKSVWSLVDDREPPAPADPDAPWPKVLAALVLEGAIHRTARGVVDRSAREAFRRLTGMWPGEEPASAKEERA